MTLDPPATTSVTGGGERTLQLVVSSLRLVADGVVQVELSDPAGSLLPPWSPGAHIDLDLGGSFVRQYSLCGSPADRSTWRVAVLREPAGRGGSAFVHDALAAGDSITVRGPRNRFQLDSAPRYLFISGGIGITPLLPMVEAVAGSGAEWFLHYGGKSRETMAFTDELLRLHQGHVRLYPEDEVGRIPLDLILADARNDTAVYCCGPAPLLDAVEARCGGLPAGALRIERFHPMTPPAAAEAERAFIVELARSGTTHEVPPDQSILEVLEDDGVEVASSCREGICGTCETVVLDGEVDHRDSLLTADERAADTMMFPCVSRARSGRLLLDL